MPRTHPAGFQTHGIPWAALRHDAEAGTGGLRGDSRRNRAGHDAGGGDHAADQRADGRTIPWGLGGRRPESAVQPSRQATPPGEAQSAAAAGSGATSATTGTRCLRYRGSSRSRRHCRGFCLLRSELGSTRFRFLEDLVVFFLVLVEEVGNVKESITFEADIHKRRLHAGEHTADAPLVNATHQTDVRIAFEIHLDQLVVFQHGDLRLVRRRGNIHLLRHGNSLFRNAGESTRQPTGISQQRS